MTQTDERLFLYNAAFKRAYLIIEFIGLDMCKYWFRDNRTDTAYLAEDAKIVTWNEVVKMRMEGKVETVTGIGAAGGIDNG